MTRIEIIQQLIDHFGFRNYLEIGVRNGKCFFEIKAKNKIAVDPEFVISSTKKFKRIFSNFSNLNNHWYEETSDDFFARHSTLFAQKKIDIALVDGMHEYAFALRDVENCLNHLTDNGVILMHDCNPPGEAQAVSFEAWKNRGYEGDWNGDVWKAVLHLRSLRNDINVFVLDTDHGLGIVTKRTPENPQSFTAAQIEAMSFKDLAASRQDFLNLKPVSYLKDYFSL
jgi:hypothetical protein